MDNSGRPVDNSAGGGMLGVPNDMSLGVPNTGVRGTVADFNDSGPMADKPTNQVRPTNQPTNFF